MPPILITWLLKVRRLAAAVPLPMLAVAVFGGALTLLTARLPEAVFRAEFWGEDGPFYAAALARGGETLFEPYAGYLLLGQRALILIETLVPPYYAPLVANVAALSAMASVATYIVVAPLPGSRGTRLGLAALFVLVPESQEMVGNLPHLQWSVAAWLALVPFAHPPSGRLRTWAESAALAVAGLTGPSSALFAPLYLFGPRRRLAVVATAGAIQMAMWLLLPTRVPSAGVDIEWIPWVILVRVLVTPVVGDGLVQAMPPLLIAATGVFTAVAVGLGLRRLNGRLAAAMCYVALVPIAAGIVGHYAATETLAHPTYAPRYFWLAGIAIAWVTLLTLRTSAPSVLLAVLLVVGIVHSFRLPPGEFRDWATNSACIGGPAPCEVPVAPRDEWAVRWEPPIQRPP